MAREVGRGWRSDDLGNAAGALTFFGVLAIFPFLLFLVSLASVVIDSEIARSLGDGLASVAPPQVTGLLGAQIEVLGRDSNPGLLTAGAVGAVWVASGGVVALIDALNRAHRLQERRPYWKVRLIAMATTLAAAALSLVAAFLAVALPALARRTGGPVETTLLWLRLPAAGLLMALTWALLYHRLPNARRPFRLFTPGSLVGVSIWLAASWGFSFYVVSFGRYEAVYGAVGGVIVLLLWMWISAQALLLGAEIDAVLDRGVPATVNPAALLSFRPPTPTPNDAGRRAPPRRAPPPRPRFSLGSWLVGLGLGLLVARRLSR